MKAGISKFLFSQIFWKQESVILEDLTKVPSKFTTLIVITLAENRSFWNLAIPDFTNSARKKDNLTLLKSPRTQVSQEHGRKSKKCMHVTWDA